jgi:dihydropteroate synthase
MALIRRLPELHALGHPVLVGPSRKSFLDELRRTEPEERLHLTLGAVLAAAAGGAHVIRVHDVLPVVDALTAFRALDPRR